MAPPDLDLDAIPDPLTDADLGAIPVPPPLAITEPSPTRAATSRRRLVVVIASAIWVASIAVLYLGLRSDLHNPPVLLQLGGFTIALPIGLAAALRPRADGLPMRVAAARVVGVAIVLVFVVLALWPVAGMEVPLAPRTVLPCLSFALAMAVAPLAGAAVVLRGAFVSAAGLRGALVGAACGLAGAIGIHAHCPLVTSSHVLIAHGSPVLLLAALGAWIGLRRGRA
ncbi:MAG: NrsF family protein [Polyangiaceae bacterium]